MQIKRRYFLFIHYLFIYSFIYLYFHLLFIPSKNLHSSAVDYPSNGKVIDAKLGVPMTPLSVEKEFVSFRTRGWVSLLSAWNPVRTLSFFPCFIPPSVRSFDPSFTSTSFRSNTPSEADSIPDSIRPVFIFGLFRLIVPVEAPSWIVCPAVVKRRRNWSSSQVILGSFFCLSVCMSVWRWFFARFRFLFGCC